MKRTRLILIGILFAGTIGILVWGLDFLKGRNFLQPEKIYHAQYEKIGGLTISSPITLKGFKVGEVREIELSGSNYDHILVTFVITYPNLELPRETIPKIYSTDLMGTKGIQLLLGKSDQFYTYGDTLPGMIEGDLKDQVNTQMLPLKQKAEDLMSSMDSVLIALQLVFDQQNRSNLAQSFEVVTQTLKNFEQTSVFLDTFVKAESNKLSLIMSNMDSIAQNLVIRTEELQNTFVNLGQFTDSLNQIPIRDAVGNFNLVLNDLSDLIMGLNQGQGSLGKLIVDDSLYIALETMSHSLDDLLVDVKENPHRYLRLSAIDRSKTYLVTENEELFDALRRGEIVQYYVVLLKTDKPIEPTNSIFSEFRNLESIQIGKTFYYYTDKTRRLSKAKRAVDKLIKNYPNAGTYTWINEEWQRVKL